MTKHLYFWLGVFLSLLLAVPVAIGAWGIAGKHAADMITFSFGVLVSLLIIMFFVLLFKKQIFKRFGVSTETSLSNVVDATAKTIGSATRGDADATAMHAGELAKISLAWYSWVSFYRWVIGTGVAMLLVFAGFTGSVLLFEQNEKIKEQTIQMNVQNELIGVTLTSDFRNRFIETSNNLSPIIQEGLFAPTRGCEFSFHPQMKPYPTPNRSTVDSLVELAKSRHLKGRMKQALNSLLYDQNQTVVLGAFLVLDNIGGHRVEELNLYNMDMRDVNIKTKIKITVESSFLNNVQCEKCTFELNESYARQVSAPSIETSFSWVDVDESQQITQSYNSIFYGSILSNIDILDVLDSTFVIRDLPQYYFHEFKWMRDDGNEEQLNCLEVKEFCTENPYISCKDKKIVQSQQQDPQQR